MKVWTIEQLITVMLGAMFALGITLSTLQAADMVGKMSADTMMGAGTAPDACGPCEGDDETASTDSCVMVCPGFAQTAASADGPVLMTTATKFRPLVDFAVVGRSSD
jgi:hypothetical protein